MILLKAIAGVFFAIVAIVVAIIVAAFIIRALLIAWDWVVSLLPEQWRMFRAVRRGRGE